MDVMAERFGSFAHNIHILSLKRAGLEVEASLLIKAEHDIHVLNGLAASAFEQVVNDAGDEQLIVELLHMNESLVCVHNLLEVEIAVNVVGKSGRSIELLIEFDDIVLAERRVNAHDFCAEDAA